MELRHEIFRNGSTAVVDDERRLIQRQLLDGETVIRRLEGQDRTGGNAVHERRSTSLLDERLNVFDFTLDCVRRRVAAVAAAPAIVGKHREVARQSSSQRSTGPRSSIAERAIHQYDRWSV